MNGLSSPPPLWWRRFERAYIAILAPSGTALLSSMIEDSKELAMLTGLIVFSMGLTKFIGMMLGSDVNYADLPTKKPE